MSNKISILAITLWSIFNLAQAQKMNDYSGNPVFEGWYADPEAAIFNHQYWIYPTTSLPYEQQIRFDAFSSKDLVTWKKHSSILKIGDISWAKKALWAPSVTKYNGKYYFFFAANDVHEREIGGIGVAVSNKPDGPFKDLLGRPLINDIKNGAQPIDQFFFQDKDSTCYLYYGGWGHCNIVKLSKDLKHIVPFENGELYKEITPENYVEGPYMLFKNGKYYFMWSEGGWTGPDYSVAYAISDSPTGPFKRIGKILQQDSTIATGAGHHSILHNPVSDKYYIVYHRRPLDKNKSYERVVCIDEMNFDKDGLIAPVKISFKGVKKDTL